MGPTRRFLGPTLRRRAVLSAGLAATVLALPRLNLSRALAESAAAVRLHAKPGQAALLPPDSAGPTPIWGFDGRVPGPVIRARRGETVDVELENGLDQPTTIHWHGVRIDNAMDGVPHLTQDPVAPGERFRYRFTVPDAGTFWYHPHHASWEQVARGLYGLLVVDEDEAPEADREILFVADDWRLGEDGRIHEASFGDLHDWAHGGRLGNVLTVNGRPPQQMVVRPNERLRLRMANMANARILTFTLDGVDAWTIAVDGQPVAPAAARRIVLAPGQRVDLMVDAPPTAGASAAIAEATGTPFTALDLVVEGEPARPQPLPAPSALPHNPLAVGLDLADALEVDLLMEGGAMGMGPMRGGMGPGMHGHGPMPPLPDWEALVGQGQVWAMNGVAGRTEVPLVTAPLGRTVVLHMINANRWPHAMHLHGHHARIVARNGHEVAPEPWRDTLLVDPMESISAAFVADNPGDWMLHCHMLEHQAGGMETWFRVDG
jgi:FtsP/CotA-like multicopper oxidase with cupredoxin domain